MFYMMKYTLLAMAWVCVAIFNGIVWLVEKIININREDPPVDETVDTNEAALIEDTAEKTEAPRENNILN